MAPRDSVDGSERRPLSGAEGSVDPTAGGLRRLLELAGQHPCATVLLVGALLYLPWLAAGPLHGSLEANRLVAAREMFDRGDWVLPTLNGEAYLRKPPFQYWLMELSFLVWGESLWSARLVSALAVMATALVVTWWGRVELGGRVGVLAGCLLATTGLYLEKGVVAELETLLAMTLTVCMLFTWRALLREGPGWTSLGAAGLALGAALLTKGPVVLVAFLPATVALALTTPGRRAGIAARTIGVLALGLLATLPWLWALTLKVGIDQVTGVFQRELLQRTHSPGTMNRAPTLFYLPALLGGLLPGSLLLPWCLRVRRPREEPARARALLTFLWVWALAPPLLLSLSAGKETRYLIFCFPAWALLLAWGALRDAAGPGLRAYRRLLAWAATGLAWLVPAAALLFGLAQLSHSRGWLVSGAALLIVAASAARWGGARRRPRLLAGALLLGLVGIKVLWAKVYLEGRSRRLPVLAMGSEVASHLGQDEELLVTHYDAAHHYAVHRALVTVADVRLRPPDQVPRFALVQRSGQAEEVAELGEWELVASWMVRGVPYDLLERRGE